MNKKVLSLVLALVIVLGTFGTVVAADEYSTQDQKIQWLIDNEIVIGRKVNADGSADLALNEFLTRAEVTKLVVYTLKQQNLADALKGVMQPFPDVDINHWANGYVSVATTQRADVANGRRIVIGYPDGKFYPNNNVTYAELATMLVRIVKKDLTDAMEKNAIWATSYMRWAEEEGILKGLTIADSNKPVPRKDAFEMIFNAMYALGDYKKGAVNFGDQLGIVSKLQAGELQLNQDTTKTYKITANTMATDGTSWYSLGRNIDSITLGSLVRVIAKSDGEVTHILELGNPRQQAIDANNRPHSSDTVKNNRWFDVADYTANSFTGFTTDGTPVEGEASISDRYDRPVITINGISAEINSGTRLFVADYSNNAFKEVKTLSEIFNLYINRTNNINNVYMGYNKFVGNNNEAKVVVFGDVDKYQGQKDVRRVTSWLQTGLRFEAEDTKGVRTIYDINNTPLFPSRNLVDVMDVVDIRINNINNDLRTRTVLIDYSEDNVYKVKELSNATREIVLEDKDGYPRRFFMPTDIKVFLEGQLKEGAHVQIDKDDAITHKVDIISVVNKDLKGILPEGVREGQVSGWISRVVTQGSADSRRATITMVDKNGRLIGNYEVSGTDYDFVNNYRSDVIGKINGYVGNDEYKVISDKTEKFGNTVYLYGLEFFEKQADADVRRANEARALYNSTGLQSDYDKALERVEQIVDRLVRDQKRAELNALRDDIAAIRQRVTNLEAMPLTTQEQVNEAKAELERTKTDIGTLPVDSPLRKELGDRATAFEKKINERQAELDAVITGIEITGPTKKAYNTGETLDTAGLVVNAKRADGDKVTVTDYTISPAAEAFTEAGTVKYTVTYQGFKATFQVTVN